MFFWLWIAVLIGSVILEIGTATALVSIWFAVGAIFGLIANQLQLAFIYQVCAFIITSLLSILLVRPHLTKYMTTNVIATNADRIIGTQTRLLKPITLDDLGEVKVNGVVWNARSFDHHDIQQDVIVEIKAIDGTKLVVVQVD
ncbi:MAG: NfeD family protein [Erysipelotrichaceae bacterium]